jgi:PAS domain S-box-containing protein
MPEKNDTETLAELTDLYDNAPCGYHSLDPAGRILRVNATELRWLGLRRDEALGRNFGAFLTPESRVRFEQNMERARVPTLSTALGSIEHEIVRGDGERRWLLVSIRVNRDARGRFLTTSASLLDVTDRKRAEVALAEREARLADFLDTASDLIQSLDGAGRFLYVNRAWEETLGFTADEARGLTVFDIVEPEHHARWRALLTDLATVGRVDAMEVVLRTKQGRPILVEGTVSVRLEEGRPATIRAFFRDVTAAREAERALRRSRDDVSLTNAALERANRAKDEFLASMSHELRTPLNAVLGLAEALQEEAYGGLADRQRRAVRRIEESGRHLLSLINDILDISKIEAGKVALELRPVGVEDAARTSLRMIQEFAHKRRVSVALQVDPGIVGVRADERRLKQILVNLLNNAVKFTPQGGTMGLDVGPADSPDGVRFTVWDTGVGIEAADQARLFQPFVQLDSSLARHHAGTGLGLALVRRLVDLHGGGITVESEPGKGSRFSFVLPGRLSSREAVVSERPPGPPARLGRALVVEESAPIAEQLARYLVEVGIDAQIDTGEGDVLARVASVEPDVLLLDLLLPTQDGRQLLGALKRDPRTAEIPVIVVTVLDDPADARALGAEEWLTKPVSRDQLRAALARVAARRGPASTRAARRSLPSLPAAAVEPLRVLIAEDEETNVTLVVDFLRAVGHDVFVARNGREAVTLTRDLRPDLIIMDIQMPVLDGLQAIREIRADADPRLAGTRIIAVTALAMSGDRDRCLAAGANDYMSKPVSLKRLGQMIVEQVPRGGP